MKRLLPVLCAVVLLACAAPVARADSVLFEWGFNIDGTIYVPGDSLPAFINAAGFDFTTGLGTIAVTETAPGAHYFLAFFDHEIDEAANTYFNEFGSTSGTPAAGQSWEIDEPGYVFGDIYDNFLASTLDNSNGVPVSSPDDVSMAMGWNFVLAADEVATINVILGTAAPAAGFYLKQTDPDSNADIYLSSSATITGGGGEPVPEPSTLLLLLGGLIAIGGIRIFTRQA